MNRWGTAYSQGTPSLQGDSYSSSLLFASLQVSCLWRQIIWKVYPLVMPLLIWSVTYKSRGQNLSQYRLEANTWNKHIILGWEDLEGWNKRITLLHDCRGQDKAFLLLLLQFWKSIQGHWVIIPACWLSRYHQNLCILLCTIGGYLKSNVSKSVHLSGDCWY